MKRQALLITATAVLLAASAGPSSARGSCTQGGVTIHGSVVMVYCGPARATVTYGGKTYVFTQGSCNTAVAGVVGVNIGMNQMTGPLPNKFKGIIMSFPSRNGAHTTGASAGWSLPPKSVVLANPRVVISGGGTRGTFSGTATLAGNGPSLGAATGTFRCS